MRNTTLMTVRVLRRRAASLRRPVGPRPVRRVRLERRARPERLVVIQQPAVRVRDRQVGEGEAPEVAEAEGVAGEAATAERRGAAGTAGAQTAKERTPA